MYGELRASQKASIQHIKDIFLCQKKWAWFGKRSRERKKTSLKCSFKANNLNWIEYISSKNRLRRSERQYKCRQCVYDVQNHFYCKIYRKDGEMERGL